MNVAKRTWFLLVWTVVLSPLLHVSGAPYDSPNDLYDTNYEYEFGDSQVREEVFITKTPQFVSPPLHLEVNEGQTVRLPCLVDRLEGFVLLWRKNNRIIAVGQQILDKSGPRVMLEHKENGNNLVITNAEHTDEAEYICSVSTYKKNRNQTQCSSTSHPSDHHLPPGPGHRTRRTLHLPLLSHSVRETNTYTEVETL